MITAVRSVQAAPGKTHEVLTFLKEVVAYIKSKHGVDLQIKAQVAGPLGRICTVVDYPSLAEYESSMAKIMADPEYHKIVAKAAGLIVPGHSHDSLWRSA